MQLIICHFIIFVAEMVIDDIYRKYLGSAGISTDSRQVKKGSIFFALKGERFNGNAYAAGALEKGAIMAVIDEPQYKIGEKCILVDDAMKTLQELAQHHRRQLKIPIIGLTGTNGKTTTKELIARVLEKKYRTLATQGNLNNHIGVPITLLGISADTEIAVIEMGANHIGEIDQLCSIARPDYGLITNIGKAHLEGFGSYEGVIRAKTELYGFLGRSGGIAVVNRDDNLLMDLSESLKR
ncbi:MAG TPA: Mur ligase family protein, partial [Bacteroidales bacterium]|nr:Mur ligase family protein [Bacteroidales bacterium]